MVIHIARRDAKLRDFAAIVDHRVQFETQEPAGRGFATRRQSGKHLVGVDTLVEANIERGRVDTTDARAMPQAARTQVHNQWHKCGGNVLHKASIADQPWELSRQDFSTSSP